ncbi:MAG TPA: HDIG domain-containing protein [Candidatus Polarisedimenticolia bacterium]|nr:HDIG domain-containing protein [Candidatus Polarisedimenticolia bacterium]
MASDDPHRARSRGGAQGKSPWAAGAGARTRRAAARLQAVCERLLGKDAAWALLVLAVLTPLVSQQECALSAPAYDVGEVATATIKAPYDIEIPDEKATLDRREAERRAVAPVFDLVVSLTADQVSRLRSLFDRGREAMADLGIRPGTRPDEEAIARLREALRSALPDRTVAMLAREGFSHDLEAVAVKLYGAAMQGLVVDSRDRLPDEGVVSVREVRPGSTTEYEFAQPSQIRDLSQARAAMAERVDRDLGDWPGADRRALLSLLDGYLISNLSYNASETERRRAAAMASVPQVFTRIPRGRVIVREGEVFTPEAIDVLGRISQRAPASVDWVALGGHALLVVLLLLFLQRYVRAHQKVFHRVKNLYTLVLLVTLFVTVGSWAGVFVADAVADSLVLAPFNDPAAYYWALPVSAGAMLITLLANGRVATVSSAFVAALFGMVLGWDARAIVFALVSSFAAIYGISKYERRTAILKACALVGGVNATVVIAIMGIEGGFGGLSSGLFQVAMAAAGGILVAPIVSFSLPMLEWLFNVLTDIRLLELSNLDNPLLRRLSVEAPGTYNHSVIAGTLAEQAAEEIGAHALLCRVAAYYHDIGKMAKPDYFVENMRDGVNRHDRLSPRMSSLIIASHVKEGMRLAEEFNLPRQIRDIIPEHHGTRLITYFYKKAQRKEDPDVPEIHESDYRYPGPKPQTKEAAIFMMADSVEAAARTVEEPTPAKFEEVITTVTNAIVLDGQLDECDLTFSDLGRIRASFLKSLVAVHHHRIAYPGFDFDRRHRAMEGE